MPYKEEETETVLPFRGGFRRGSWNARRALLRPLYCLLVGDNISVLLSALGTPSGLLEQSQWLYLERAQAQMERPWAPGTEPPALSGTRFSANGTLLGHLEQSLRLYLERALAHMERAQAQWNALGPLEQSRRLPGTRASASPLWGVGTNCKAPLFYRPIHIRVGW